ncbi:hypothetical protein B0G81_4033 [Paraburkholderia sp. BL6665CI2N2]|uniref:hypothetical protein n=1 Tax=Paraburkholderia sp. BL6665CI2N2 TaxID=1938806 RepID=UPI0010666DF7|nr:hypothetical protein [Paraburkholderia sp. BL6665CI2N2]TDY23646.1 hypothetical protein B0G81_4033 [Paraburkholderia sp. BL6665CI2N2]
MTVISNVAPCRFNRQLHPGEKKITDQANGDKAEEVKLTKAACYAVKCWAEYPKGSDQYNANYVSQLDASQLVPELSWVKNQKEAGLFNYTPEQKVTDMVKSDPLGIAKDAAKVVVGAVTVKTGVGLCATALGCSAGVPMAAFSTSDMAEGMESLYNRYDGINSSGVNPLRYVFNEVSPTWDDTMYDTLNLGASALALRAQVPLKMGVADGMNRSGTIFDVTVPRMNNNTLVPFLNTAAPYGTTQAISAYGIASKGATLIKDATQAGSKK